MQFRVKSSWIHVLQAAPPEEGQKKAAVAVVAALRRASPKVTDEMREALPPEDIAEIEAYLASLEAAAALEAEAAALRFPETIESFVTALEAASGDRRRLLLDHAEMAARELRRAILRARPDAEAEG